VHDSQPGEEIKAVGTEPLAKRPAPLRRRRNGDHLGTAADFVAHTGSGGVVRKPVSGSFDRTALPRSTLFKMRGKTMTGTRRARALALAAVVAGALIGPSVTPAAADAPSGSSHGASSTDACLVTKFGYSVDTMCDSTTMGLDNNGDGVYDEYFDIRYDRVVVHVWSGSGGWRPLANGRADRMYHVTNDLSTGYRLVQVWVDGSGVWCTSYMPGRDWYNFWKC
jgi:hypothetical protein